MTKKCGRKQKDLSLPCETLAYITTLDGVGIDGYRAKEIRDTAKSLFMGLPEQGFALKK